MSTVSTPDSILAGTGEVLLDSVNELWDEIGVSNWEGELTADQEQIRSSLSLLRGITAATRDNGSHRKWARTNPKQFEQASFLFERYEATTGFVMQELSKIREQAKTCGLL